MESEQNNSKNIDLLTCNYEITSEIRELFTQLESENNLTINYSLNNTGSVPNSDWIMENTGRSVKEIYFTDTIDGYQYVLGSNKIIMSGSTSDILVVDQNFVDTSLNGVDYQFNGNRIEISGNIVLDQEYIQMDSSGGTTLYVVGLPGSFIDVSSGGNSWSGLVKLLDESYNVDISGITIDLSSNFPSGNGITDIGGGIIKDSLLDNSFSGNILVNSCNVIIGNISGSIINFGGLIGENVGYNSSNSTFIFNNNNIIIGDIEILYENTFGGLVGQYVGYNASNTTFTFNNNNVIIGDIVSNNNNTFGGLVGQFVGRNASNATFTFNNNNVTIKNVYSDNNSRFGGLLGQYVGGDENRIIRDSNNVSIDNISPNDNNYGYIMGFSSLTSTIDITMTNTFSGRGDPTYYFIPGTTVRGPFDGSEPPISPETIQILSQLCTSTTVQNVDQSTKVVLNPQSYTLSEFKETFIRYGRVYYNDKSTQLLSDCTNGV